MKKGKFQLLLAIKFLTMKYIPLLFLFLIACNSNKNSVKYIKSYSFDLPYNIAGVYTNEGNDNIYFQSYSPNTYKRIDQIDSEGKLLSSFSLKELAAAHPEMHKIIPHKDQYYAFTKYSGEIIVLNDEFQILNTFKIDANYEQSEHIEPLPAMVGNTFLDDHTILLSPHYYFLDEISTEQHYEYYRLYPHLIKVDLSDTSALKTRFCLENFFSHFIVKGNTIMDFGGFYVAGDKIILYNPGSDSLYIADTSDCKIKYVQAISSQYSTLKMNPVPLKDNDEQSINQNIKMDGYIIGIQHDSYREKNYVYVQYKNEISLESNEPKPWGILVYDKNFKFLKEVKIDHNKYEINGIILVKDGILLRKYLKDKLLHNEFDLVEI